MKHAIAAILSAFAVAFGPSLAEAAIVVGAPDPTSSSWVSQSGVPPSGPVFNYAAEFSLSSDTFVTTIDLFLYGADVLTELNISLGTTVGASNVFSADFFISDNTSQSFSLPINAVLLADTYFLTVFTNGFVGWQLGDTTSLVETGGSVALGQWQIAVTGGGAWIFVPGSGPSGGPGNFAVNGLDPPEVPLPAAWILLASALAAGSLGKRLRNRR